MSSMILVNFELGIPVISLIPRKKEIEWIHDSIRNVIPICFSFDQFLGSDSVKPNWKP